MKINNENYPKICEQLYNSEDYNKAVSVLAFTKDKKQFAKYLLETLKIQQKVMNDIEE